MYDVTHTEDAGMQFVGIVRRQAMAIEGSPELQTIYGLMQQRDPQVAVKDRGHSDGRQRGDNRKAEARR